jgi:ADP-heptose:LPS heptosyltransferase
VIALPSLHLVARAFPNAERRMLTNLPVNSKAPAAEAVLGGSGLVQGYFTYKVATRNLLELAGLWWRIAWWRPQVVVYLAAFRSQGAVVRDSRFFALCAIKRKVGVPLTQAMQKSLWREAEQAFEPEAGRLARNLAELGDGRLDDPVNWDLRLSEGEKAAGRKAIASAQGRPIIAVSIGAKAQVNDWGAENWWSLLASVAARFPEHALALCGAAVEFEASEAVAEGWRQVRGADAAVINLCGQLTPRVSAAVLAEARVFIGHDSGPGHLAAAMQTPCVSIFSARNKPRVWFPYGKRNRVIYHQVDCWGCGLETCVVEQKKCILSITVDEVMAEIEAALRAS